MEENNNRLFEMADHLKEMKDRKKALEAEVSNLETKITAADSELAEAMTSAECDKFGRGDYTFYLNSRLYASPLAGKKGLMIQALKDNGYGDLVTETVNANTLSSFCKERMTENNDELPEWLSQNVNTFEKVTVGIRKG